MRRQQFASPLALYKHTLKELEAEKKSGEKMHRHIAESGELDYLDLTKGRLSPKQTRGKFARRKSGRRRGGGSVPLLPINRVTGRLARSIRIVEVPGKHQAFHVGPSKAAGRSMFVMLPAGTRFMVARGIYAVIEARWKARNKALLDTLRKPS